MTATRMATLDGTWELHPMIVLQPVEPHTGLGFTINYEDIRELLAAVEDDPTVIETGFRISLGTEATHDEHGTVEFPPGEPARNAIAALRWYHQALAAAGPMPYTTG
jgi:hypothetical protein